MIAAPTDFWPETLTCLGYTATREQMEQAWEAWEGGAPFGLTKALFSAGAGDQSRRPSCSYLANAMLKRASEADLVEFDKGWWVEVSKEDAG